MLSSMYMPRLLCSGVLLALVFSILFFSGFFFSMSVLATCSSVLHVLLVRPTLETFEVYLPCAIIYVIVIARGQGFMAVNRLESEGVSQGQGWFTSP